MFPTSEWDPLGMFSWEGGSQTGCSGANLPRSLSQLVLHIVSQWGAQHDDTPPGSR